MTTILYGIKNCDSIKKARKWLDSQSIDYSFHDFRVDGLPQELLDQWITELGWELLLNRRGTTWRQQPDEIKESINASSARALMLEFPAIIKRPVLDTGELRHVGFKETEYLNIFKNQTS